MRIPANVVTHISAELARNMFTTLAMMSPMTANRAKRPIAERSRLVTAPKADSPANVPPVMRNVLAIDPDV